MRFACARWPCFGWVPEFLSEFGRWVDLLSEGHKQLQKRSIPFKTHAFHRQWMTPAGDLADLLHQVFILVATFPPQMRLVRGIGIGTAIKLGAEATRMQDQNYPKLFEQQIEEALRSCSLN